MLLFIVWCWCSVDMQYMFQYISCYSLSIRRKYWRIPGISFNTSHVTLYPKQGAEFQSSHTFQYISCYSLSPCYQHLCSPEHKFQYISCYSLSEDTFKSLVNPVMFQYISCYSLSSYKMIERTDKYCFNTSHVTLYQNTISGSPAIRPSFNTSHVTLYPSSETTCISRYRGFNTSHVTLYQTWSGWKRDSISVSIHLMLLFIRTPGDQCVSDKCVSIHLMLLFISGILCTALAVASFQYISYYSLSDSCKWRQILYHVSIHLMLLFIQHRDGILPAR